MIKLKKKFIATIVVICVILTGFIYKYNLENARVKEAKEDIKREINIMATGDIMYHKITYINNFNEEKGEYDFSSFYDKMKPYIDSSDIMVGNYETTSDPNREYSGFPCFNTPPESVKYLKEIGFDALSTANNHCVDTGENGIISTIDIMNENNIKHFGTYKENIDRGIIIEKDNIKVGFLSYSESFNGMDQLVSQENKFMISPFNLDQIKEDIEKLNEKGANFIVIYPHWGVEYAKQPSDFQKNMNDELFKLGADVVLGSHPHVLQRVEEKIIDGKKKFTIYSMGNSISNQRKEWMKRDGTETGVFVSLNISKKDSENKAVLENVSLIPTYVHRYKINNRTVYEVIALKDLIDGGVYRDILDEGTKYKVDKHYEDAMEILYSLGDDK